MPMLVIAMSATAMCGHGGRVVFMPNNSVLLGGTPAAMGLPVHPIAGCPLLVPDVVIAPQPPSFTQKVLSNGMPLLLMTLNGAAAPSGGPVMCVSPGQNKVTAT